jgi:hypothetical protein
MEMTVWDFPFSVCFIVLLLSVRTRWLVAVTVNSGLLGMWGNVLEGGLQGSGCVGLHSRAVVLHLW